MRILITGGGTSGHVNPAIAIANYMKQTIPDTEILFIGTQNGIESRLVPAEGYNIEFIKVKGFRRKLTLKNIDAAIKAVTSQIEARKIIKRFKPDLAIAMGGFVSGPVMAQAAKLKIPTAIHESNAYPGLTTRILSKSVDKIMICFEETKKHLKYPEKCVLTGNPVRNELLSADSARAKNELGITHPLILSCAGSMGSSTINEIILNLMRDYTSKLDATHIHAAGVSASSGYTAQKTKFEEMGLNKNPNLEVLDYYSANHLVGSDIIISRAGATTISELAILGKSAILVPSPYVTENHQYKNAKVLADSGAAILIEEKNCNSETLAAAIDDILSGKKPNLSSNIRKYADRKAIQKIYYVLTDLTKKKSKQ